MDKEIRLYPHAIYIGASFPVVIGLHSDGELFFRPIGIVNIYDYCPDGVSGIFDNNGFSLWKDSIDNKLDYVYDVPYAYKNMPMLKEWLIQQHLELPE